MWFRIFVGGWSVAFLALLGWLATHQSSEPAILGRYSPGYFTLLLGIAFLAGLSLLAHAPFFYQRLHALRREIALTAVSVPVTLVLAEATVRAFDPLGVSYFEESARYHLDKLADPVLVYRHAPGIEQIYQGVKVSTNRQGFRERELQKKADGELRILLLGDSVTFGWGVPVEATFGRKLEDILGERLGRRVTTVNTGVGSYNTVQEYAVLKTYADVIEPDIVLLIYVNNDTEPNDPPFDPWSELSLRDKSPPEVMTLVTGKSWLVRLGHFALRYAGPGNPAALDTGVRGVVESLNAISGIACFSGKRRLAFATFFYRSKNELSNVMSSALLAEIQAVGERHGFPVIDVGTWWGDTDMRALMNSTVDSHLNARGHEILAAGIADAVMKHGLATDRITTETVTGHCD